MEALRAILCAAFALGFAACDKPAAPAPPATPPSATPKSAEQIWQDVSPSLIYVSARGIDGGVMQGSGFVVELDGKRLILTNRHVVKGAEKVSIGTDTKSLVVSPGYKIAANLDLAVVECPADVKAPALPLATRTLNPGAEVVALGFPLGIGKIITRGIVSSVEDGHILFDAPISSGNSGGPVVNHFGEVVAVATMGSKNTGAAIVQNLNLGIRVTAIPKLPLFTDPLIRLGAVADRIREVEAFIEKGYRKDEWFKLCDLIIANMMMEGVRAKDPEKWQGILNSEDGKKGINELAERQRSWETRDGSLRKALERYVAFLKECEERIDALTKVFAGLGADPVLADFLNDQRQGAWIRIDAPPELLPKLARISADHWMARFEDHRFRIEWSLRYGSPLPSTPKSREIDETFERLRKSSFQRPSIRLGMKLSGDRAADLTSYVSTMFEWSSRSDVFRIQSENSSILGITKPATKTDPIEKETAFGNFLSTVSQFRQHLAIELGERGQFDKAIALLREEVASRSPSAWSGMLLAQMLAYSGRFDEAWRAYAGHFSLPAPFDAFQIELGWGGASVVTMAQIHVCEGYNTQGPTFQKQYGNNTSVVANVAAWNKEAIAVRGRELKMLPSLKAVLSDPWFGGLSRLDRIRVLTYFRHFRQTDEAILRQRYGAPVPPWNAQNDLDFIKKFEDDLSQHPEVQSLWKEVVRKEGLTELF